MVRAHVLSGHDFSQWRKLHSEGHTPSALPYGVDVLERHGWSLSSAGRADHPAVVKLRNVVEHRTGMTVEQPVRSIRGIAKSDLVLTLLEREAFLPGLVKGWRVPPFSKRPLVIWSCWLADDLMRADTERRRWLIRRIQSADLIAHLSRHETEVFTSLGIHEDRLFTMTYGVSHDYYTPQSHERDISILAVGQDRGRDYGTLIEAVRDTRLTLDIVCKPDNLRGITLPENVRYHGTVPIPTYRRLLSRANVVAVPTTEMAYPTGSSVALEAASSGCAVVVTGTRAMRDFFEDNRSARFVGEADIHGWRIVLQELTDDPRQVARLGEKGREVVVQRHNADYMWTELADTLTTRGIC